MAPFAPPIGHARCGDPRMRDDEAPPDSLRGKLHDLFDTDDDAGEVEDEPSDPGEPSDEHSALPKRPTDPPF
jgi:hypothetical protein